MIIWATGELHTEHDHRFIHYMLLIRSIFMGIAGWLLVPTVGYWTSAEFQTTSLLDSENLKDESSTAKTTSANQIVRQWRILGD